MKRQSLLVDEESKLIQSMQTSIMVTNQEMRIINIPKIAFRFFIHIADGNSDNGSLAQTMCYLLGPKQKTSQDEIWIDTILIPNQTRNYLLWSTHGLLEKIDLNSPQMICTHSTYWKNMYQKVLLESSYVKCQSLG